MNQYRHWRWEIGSYDNGLPWSKRWNEERRVPVQISTGPFDRAAIIVVRQAMNN